MQNWRKVTLGKQVTSESTLLKSCSYNKPKSVVRIFPFWSTSTANFCTHGCPSISIGKVPLIIHPSLCSSTTATSTVSVFFSFFTKLTTIWLADSFEIWGIPLIFLDSLFLNGLGAEGIKYYEHSILIRTIEDLPESFKSQSPKCFLEMYKRWEAWWLPAEGFLAITNFYFLCLKGVLSNVSEYFVKRNKVLSTKPNSLC